MEDYKKRILEIEEESTRLIEALKGLETNAKALNEAKGDMQTSTAKIVEFLGPLKSVTQEISSIAATSNNIINGNIKNQEKLESKINNSLHSQTKAIDLCKDLVEDNIKRQKKIESKINDRLSGQAKIINLVAVKQKRLEILTWLILALLAVISISSFVLPSVYVGNSKSNSDPKARNQIAEPVATIRPSADSLQLNSETTDTYSGYIVCKGENCEDGLLIKKPQNGGFYGCNNFEKEGCKYTVDYPIICKGCKKSLVKRPKGSVKKDGKPVLIWGCPDYLETRSKDCEEYWYYKS